MSLATGSYPVPPSAVYVWRGFKSAALDYDGFATFLGTVFVPACAMLQPAVGLRAYLPSMVPQDGKPAAVPDQTALMFWRTSTAHDEAKAAIAVRIYSNLHGDVYDTVRSKLEEVPLPFRASVVQLVAEQPYYLVAGDADWMHGTTRHFVGARKPTLREAEFLAAALAWAKAFSAAGSVNGALICCGNDYLAVWLHSAEEGAALAPLLAGLDEFAAPLLSADAQTIDMDAHIWDDWKGLDLTTEPCLNLRFARHQEAAPRKRATV